MLLTLILLILAGLSKAFLDAITHHKLSFWGDFWNPKKSWRNKYKLGKPELGPKFLGSTTFFVMFTDGYHLFQFFTYTALQLALVVNYDYVQFFCNENLILLNQLEGNIIRPLKAIIELLQSINTNPWANILLNLLFVKFIFNSIFQFYYSGINKQFLKWHEN